MSRRTESRSPYGHRAWAAVRAEVLQRDEFRCQLRRSERCEGVASEVDHVVPWRRGGAWFDPSNLRAACRSCNAGRAGAEKHTDGWRAAATRVVLVAGPPGAGKSTFVDEHRAPGDLVVDYDRLAEALGSSDSHGHDVAHETVASARGAVLNRIRRGESGAATAWIISANPRAESLFPHHEVVVCDPGRDEVLRRVEAAGRPASWERLVEDWYRARERVTGGREW